MSQGIIYSIISKGGRLMQKKQHSLYNMTMMSFFIALIIIQTFVPWLGYLPLGVTNVTIVHVTVIIAGIILGPKNGAFLGLIWGVLAIIRNIMQPTVLSPVFINPLVALPGRILVGLIIGFLADKFTRSRPAYFVYGALGSLINTSVTMTAAYLFAKEAIFSAMGITSESLFSFILTIITANGILEAVIASLLVGILTPVLLKALKTKMR